jgi:hypothetical protein
MKKIVLIIALCAITVYISAETRYVTVNGTGDGTDSWSNASNDLQLMINNSVAGDVILVGAGTHYAKRPVNNPNSTGTSTNRYKGFLLDKDVKIYGGYPANGGAIRIPSINKTILYGEDKSYHVVVSIGDIGTACLDGFYITGGNANASGSWYTAGHYIYHNHGAGIYLLNSTLVLNNIWIHANQATQGSAIYMYNSSSTITNTDIYNNNGSEAIRIVNSSCIISSNTKIHDNSGYGIYNQNSSPTISNTQIYRNSKNGIYNHTSNPILNNVTIYNHTVNGHGAGIYNYNSSPTIRNSTIYDNLCLNVGCGGGIYNGYNSSPVIESCTIKNNEAKHGGGIYNEANVYITEKVLQNLTIESNRAEQGAGIYNNSGNRYQLLNSWIINNSTFNGEGGGVFNKGFIGKFINVIVAKNSSWDGGGFYNTDNSSFDIINATIIDNIAINNLTGGNALYNVNSRPTIYNTIICGNNNLIQNDNYSTPRYYYCLVESGSIQGSGNLPAGTDPRFVNRLTGNYRLRSSSPCVNSGNPYAPYTNTDILGNARTNPDIGAYEYMQVTITPNGNGVVHVNMNVPEGTGRGDDWVNAAQELADALIAAKNNTAIKEIWVAKATYNPAYKAAERDVNGNVTTDRHKSFVMVPNVKVYGGFTGAENETSLSHRNWENNPTILSGDIGIEGNSSDNVYHVVIGAGDLGIPMLDGFTITGGNANGGGASISIGDYAVSTIRGGGLYIDNPYSMNYCNLKITANNASTGGGVFIGNESLVVLDNVEVSYNTASSSGGGFYVAGNQNNILVINKGTIHHNSAGNYGGGINNGYSYVGLDRVTLSHNTSLYGGAVYSSSGILLMTNTAILNNTAQYWGSAIYNSYGTLTFTNISVIGNTSMSNYNAIYNLNAPLNIRNSIVWGNNPTQGIYHSGTGSLNCYNSFIQGQTSTANGNISPSVDPLFVDAANGNYRLLPESPLVEAGNNTYISHRLLDLDDKTRIMGQAVDIGVYEFQKPVITPNASGIVFVNQNVTTGNGSGNSWFNAAQSLADVLHDAGNKPEIQQIWVAKGTYKPKYKAANTDISGNPATNRHKSFVMVSNVRIYGGFSGNGTETAISQRNWENNPTILSGDIDVPNNNSDNVNHVVIVAGNLGMATLDGFTITGGNANTGNSITVNRVDISSIRGGGICFISSNMGITLKNLKITGNTASSGGGMFIESNDSRFENLSFTNNTASSSGGGICSFFTNLILDKGLFENNTSTYGGAINIGYESEITCINATFKANTATQGGAIYNNTYSGYFPSVIRLINVALTNNHVSSRGSALYNYGGTGYFINVTVAGNSAEIGYISPIWNDNYSQLTILNSIIAKNGTVSNLAGIQNNNNSVSNYSYSLIQNMSVAGINSNLSGTADPRFVNAASGNYRLSGTSPSSPCINAGTSSPDLPVYDLDGNYRFYNAVDMGAYEYQGVPQPAPPITGTNGKTQKSMQGETADIQNNNTELMLSVYPNPIQKGQQLSVELKDAYLPYTDRITIKLYAATGEVIYSKINAESHAVIDLPQLASGIYVLSVQTEQGQLFSKKITVK